MKRVLCVLILACCASAQEPAKPKPESAEPKVHKFVEVKHLEPRTDRRHQAFQLMWRLTGIEVVESQELKTVALRGTPAQVQEAEILLKRFDVPVGAEEVPRQVQVTVFIVEGSNQPVPEQPTLPSAMKSVVEQLRTVFPYKEYRLLDTLLLQGRTGSDVSQSGVIPSISEYTQTTYSVQYKQPTYSDATKTLNLSGFRINMRLPVPTKTEDGKVTQWNYAESGISTDLSLRDGQKLVLGKLNRDRADRAMFVVVTAKVD